MSGAAASLSHGHVPVTALRLLGDDRLARRAAEGDNQAFAALYQRHHQALYRYCRAILGNSDDAADALQNTMAAALRALAGERREIRVKPWLYRIAHNESISLLRRRPPHAGLEEAVNVAAPSGADAATRERLRQLVADVRELPDRQRTALVMRELNGLDYGEIGAAIGCNAAATKQTVYEARTALHEMADGRDMSCEEVCRSLSCDDRRMLRGRKLRAHLRACAGCRDFQTAMDLRRRDFKALAPPIPVALAAGLLNGLAGGGHGGGLTGLTGVASGGTGKALATSALAKGIAGVAIVATAGAGTAAVSGNLPEIHSHRSTPAARTAANDNPAPTARSLLLAPPGLKSGRRALHPTKSDRPPHARSQHARPQRPGVARRGGRLKRMRPFSRPAPRRPLPTTLARPRPDRARVGTGTDGGTAPSARKRTVPSPSSGGGSQPVPRPTETIWPPARDTP
jgi:RNA polymerase sigma factor (sigma-70 family)